VSAADRISVRVEILITGCIRVGKFCVFVVQDLEILHVFEISILSSIRCFLCYWILTLTLLNWSRFLFDNRILELVGKVNVRLLNGHGRFAWFRIGLRVD